EFGTPRGASAGAKIGACATELGDDLFLARKQIGLDVRSLPRVVGGRRYDTWMTGAEWNAWVKDAGFEDRYKPEEVKAIVVPDETPTHTPLVISPDGKTT